ncbi:MAG: RNA polymerase sigma factor (sigma-70 family) [Psychromonas sp.]
MKHALMTKILSLFSTEHSLAKALQRGDKKAQTHLYDHYSSLMLVICMRYMGDKMAAEDVMLKGFMRIFDKVDQFNFKGSFEGWIKRIMVNEALMKIRSSKRFEVGIEEVSVSHFETKASSRLEEADLLLLIRSLPIGYRTVFNLYAIEGFSHSEIAEKLSVSEGTSKSQLSRARAMLQSKLKIQDKELQKEIK